MMKISAAVFTVALVFRGTWASYHCQCQGKNSPFKTIQVACREGPFDAPVCRTAMRASMPPGYRYFPDFGLLKLHALSKSYEAAQRTCEVEGGRLAIPRNQSMGVALTTFFSSESSLAAAWIGINDFASNGDYVGADGEPAPWLNWQKDDPNHGFGIEHCVQLKSGNVMNDYICESPSPFFCEKLLKAPLPSGYEFLQDHGFYRLYKSKLTYEEAEDTCKEHEAHLAVPETEGEALALNLLVRKFEDVKDVWIGISDEVNEGHFVTVHGTPMEDLEFTNWQDREPNDSNGQVDCVTLLHSGVLNDSRCSKPHAFVCELEM